jgi:hypothetical protein
MQALLDYLQAAPRLPYGERPNVAEEGVVVRSLTVGLVNQRPAYGISHATTHDHLRLLHLLLGLVDDPQIAGERPPFWTSLCLNVDYGCGLHTDGRNDRDTLSYICAVGDYEGGELWVAKEPEQEREKPHTVTVDAAERAGVCVDIKKCWYAFDGAALPHMTLAHTGYRVSVVCFCVPAHKCDMRDLSRLAALGFRVPQVLPLSHMSLPWPYQVFCCSTRRSGTIARDTLATVLADRSIPPHAVTLCLRDADDERLYRHLGLRVLISEDGQGLPEQRKLCTRYRPAGSWCFFIDDDLTNIHKPEHLNLHELVMLGFLTAKQRHVYLWGLNTSADGRNRRDNYSNQLGLICGYLFGLITNPELADATRVSDSQGGAGEDIERSLRYYAHSGLVRLCFGTCCARNRSNPGGLQHHFAAGQHRQAAHDRVLNALAAEFPKLVAIAPDRPNRCRLQQPRASPRPVLVETYGEEEETTETEGSDGGMPLEPSDSSEATVVSQSEERAHARHACDHCRREYARKADLQHHLAQMHSDAPAVKVACPTCERAFRRRKDMVLHVRLGRCHSRRGKKWDA